MLLLIGRKAGSNRSVPTWNLIFGFNFISVNMKVKLKFLESKIKNFGFNVGFVFSEIFLGSKGLEVRSDFFYCIL